MRALRIVSQLAVSLLVIAAAAQAPKAEMSDAAYTKLALSAAPKAIADGAAVMRMDKDGKMRPLRAGNNGFTCMMVGTDKMCNDANSMEFIQAMMSHNPPPDKLGLSYMPRRRRRQQHRSLCHRQDRGQSLDRHRPARHGFRAGQQDHGPHGCQRPGPEKALYDVGRHAL
jgi:hypothetical protein